MTIAWADYYLQFPVAGITLALQFLTAVRAAGFMGGTGRLPDNMLGDKRDATGAIYVVPTDGSPDTHAFCGRPALGDPTTMLVVLRSPMSHADATAMQTSLGLNPAAYGITPADPALCAATMGVWE